MLNSIIDRLFQNIRTKKVLSVLGSGDSTLDIGCNENLLFFQEIKKRFKNYIGIDIRIKKHNSLNFVKFFVRDSLPFKDCSFDVVTMIAVLEHLESKEAAMSDIFRVLKRDGRIIMTVPSQKAEYMIRSMAFLRLISKELADEHNSLMNKKQIKELLNNIGFRCIKISKFEFGLNYLIYAEK